MRYIHSDEHHHIEICIKAPKTDQLRKGTTVALGDRGALPVAAIPDFLTIRRKAPVALFTNSDGTPMCRRQFVGRMPQALHRAGVNEQHFNGHSFRSEQPPQPVRPEYQIRPLRY